MPKEFVDAGLRLEIWLVPVIGFSLLAVAAVLFFIWVRADHGPYDDGYGWGVSGILASIFGVIAVVIWLIMLVPYQGKYHHLYHVDGTVSSVSNVLTEASGDLTRQPIVQLEGSDTSFLVSDSRVVNLIDKEVTLICSVEFVYLGADRYDCLIAEVR